MTETNPSKVITVISRQAPYGSNRAQQCLDIALASAVFEQSVNYVFMGDGVYQLLKNQNATGIQTKTLANALETLDLYGINNVYVDKQSLELRNLQNGDLAIDATAATRDEIANLVEASDSIFNL